jgi:hypothetical protein
MVKVAVDYYNLIAPRPSRGFLARPNCSIHVGLLNSGPRSNHWKMTALLEVL